MLSQTNNSGGYAVTPGSTATCAGIVTVSSVTAATFSITPVGVGTCTLVATGAAATSTPINVSVTSTTIIVQ